MPAESTQFVFPIQGAATLRELNSMRLDGLLTDVTIVTGDRELKCHRAVLAASCPYFKFSHTMVEHGTMLLPVNGSEKSIDEDNTTAMFSHGLRECFEKSVTLYGVKHRAMELVLQYAYMGTCVITKENAPDLLTAADLLGLIPLRDAASKFLEKCINVQNCLQIRQLADEHCCHFLQKVAINFARKHFTSVVLQESFLELNVGQVTSYLDDDDLQVGREDVVYDAAMKWIRHDPNGRNQFVLEVLESVRLPFVKPEYLKLQATVDPLIYHNTACERQVLKSRFLQISDEGHQQFLGKQRKPRKCASKEVLVLFGGVTQNGDLNDVVTFDPSTEKWGKLGEIPRSFNAKAFAASSLGYEIIITGGIRDNKALNDVIIFYTYSNQWCPSAPMVRGRYHHACVVVNGNVYVLGGTDGKNCLNDVEMLQKNASNWREMFPLPHAVKCPAVTPYDEKIFVFGGFSDSYAMCKTVQIYTTATDTWTITSTPWVDYACAHATVTSSKIYLLGGSSKNVKVYDPITEEWTNGQPMLQKRDNCGVTSVRGKLFVSGGLEQSTGPSLSSVECFCPVTDSWISTIPMMAPLHRHQSVCVRIPIYEREPISPQRTEPEALKS